MNIGYQVNECFFCLLIMHTACELSPLNQPIINPTSCFVIRSTNNRKFDVKWPEGRVRRSSGLRGGAWALKSLDALNASVRQGWAGTIGAQLRMQLDKAWSVITGIHFSREGTMCSASALHSTGRLTNTTLSTGTSAAFSDAGGRPPIPTFLMLTRGPSVHTHSLKRRLWILVMAFEAMGLPMPELAGEPWDTGVML